MRQKSSLTGNFFKFATKEISHSAFWAWVIECTSLNDLNLSTPRQLGMEFLTRVGCGDLGLPESVDVEHPLKDEVKEASEKYRFDIRVRFHDGSILVIENKLNAKLTAEQLDKYRTELKSKNVRLVFLTVDFWYDYDKYIPQGWISISAEDVRDIFRGTEYSNHPVTRDYYEWLTERLAEWENSKSAIWSTPASRFDNEVEKWEFLKETFARPYPDKGVLELAYNRDGSSYVCWTFYFQQISAPKYNDNYPEYLYYRIDVLSKGPQISIRQYYKGNHKDAKLPDEREQTRLNARERNFENVRAAFAGALAESDSRFASKFLAGKGKGFEREIGHIALTSTQYSTRELSGYLCAFHQIFVDHLKRIDPMWPLTLN